MIVEFTSPLLVAPFGADAANRFGQVGALLARNTLIAAHALTLDVTLVSNNARHCARIRGLRTESWL